MAVKHAHDFFFQWHLTDRCNLACTHCYQEGAKTAEMSLSQVKAVIEEIADMIEIWSWNYGIDFSPSLNITGGEPFLHRDIFEILEELRRRRFEIFLLSNGTLINKDKARFLSWLGMKGVQVSIEGPEEIHDSIRGRGSFASSLRGIEHLVNEGVMVSLNVTLSDINADRLPDMVALSSSLGVQRLGFSRLVPYGRGAELMDRILERDRVRDLYQRIFSIESDGLKIVTGDPLASQMFRSSNSLDEGTVPLGGCAAGISGLTLLPDGTVLPCRRLPVPIGNVKKDSLREIWAISEVLNAIRDKSRYKGKCGKCRKWANCRGCRAIAYAYSRLTGMPDFLSEDPQCYY